MNYHNITKDDMLNGPGLRVVLWVAGCSHYCKNCQNHMTWDPNSGLIFDEAAKKELFAELEKDYVDGITFSGGDPLYSGNLDVIEPLVANIHFTYPNKTIWMYTGYSWEDLVNDDDKSDETKSRRRILDCVDVLVDGRFVEELKDINYPWAGSRNQRVIDVQKSLECGCAIFVEG